ncbi:hypothetical protein [Marinifilum caeruleilacunae]|uniref:DUF304 domain-containing protein n=1 Tax=Marinifilum caeruleilacunae TaxID=2499076 RepID=A0ABX1X279_9BACT|nr:hypothetical protein [Marinifilum caeruleilacunae]NOU62236.1 hypothetical protein [Marinifilum caeruleilacunae]
MITEITFEGDKIKLKSDKDRITTTLITTLSLTIIYCYWWIDLISDVAKSNIIGNDNYILWIPVAVIIYIIGFWLLLRFTTKSFGDLEISLEEKHLYLVYTLYGFEVKTKFDTCKIKKIRIIDKGYFTYRVGFNYSKEEKYIGLGWGSNEQIAKDLFFALKDKLKINQ